MIGGLLRAGPRAWRSKQFAAALSLPPVNHVALGGGQSSPFVNGAIHSIAPAIRSQYASGSRSASATTLGLLMNARARNASGGGKDRFSVRRTSMSDI